MKLTWFSWDRAKVSRYRRGTSTVKLPWIWRRLQTANGYGYPPPSDFRQHILPDQASRHTRNLRCYRDYVERHHLSAQNIDKMAKKGESSACLLQWDLDISPFANVHTNRTQLTSSAAKARLLNVRLISMAMTGFFYTFKRPRTSPMMGMLKYDPIGTKLSSSLYHIYQCC